MAAAMSGSLFFGDFLRDKYARANVLLLAEREIRSRTIGTYFGIGHYVLLPVVMLLVYTFVFGAIFKARWPNGTGGFLDFSARIFVGLIAFQFVSDVLNRAPSLILENASYVKKVLFPLETLVPIAGAVALFNAAISTAVLLVVYLFTGALPPLTVFWVPVLWIPLILFTLGAGWFLAALGVYLRDLRQLIGILMSFLMFLSPIFYSIEAVPSPYRILLLLNPLSPIIESMRSAIFLGIRPSFVTLAMLFVVSGMVAQIGYWVFMRARAGFADVV